MIRNRVPLFTLLIAAVSIVSFARGGDDPTTQHTVISASDKKAIDENMGKEVVIVGEIASAAWSGSGKVMNVEFKDADESRLLAVVFERNRERLDEMFNGDLAKALTGAKVRLMGKLQEYGGRDEKWKGRPQIIIDRSSQITIIEPAKE
jgi:hypothetical protein